MTSVQNSLVDNMGERLDKGGGGGGGRGSGRSLPRPRAAPTSDTPRLVGCEGQLK